uniref:Uncharacterized protein n=1 Tax=Anguilla anguilla TaxID=7936 RepID=A0A0E9V908_ANGAN
MLWSSLARLVFCSAVFMCEVLICTGVRHCFPL